MPVDLRFVPTPLARLLVGREVEVVEASPSFEARFGTRPDDRLDVPGSFDRWAQEAASRRSLDVEARVGGSWMRLSFRAEASGHVVVAAEQCPDRRFEQIVQESPDIIAVIDRQFRHVFVNRAIESASGMTPSDFEGKDHSDLGMPAELVTHFQAVYRRVFETGEEGRKDFGFPAPSGEIRSYVSRVVPLREPDGRVDVLLSYARDLTERERAEDERLALERKLQETQRLESLGLLAGGIAHDFNNLLTSILGNASVARAGGHDPDRAFAQIESAALRAADLCMQMLSYAGLRQRHEEAVSVSRLVRELVDLIGASGSKNARVMLDLPPSSPWTVADRSQVQQVVMNFVINALEALPGGAGEVTVSVREAMGGSVDWSLATVRPSDPAGRFVVVAVRDSGIGMDPATLARVFDPFFTTKFTGRGLGLAATLGIVRAHGGGLVVRSATEEGSTFEVWLRAADPEELPEAPRPSRVPSLRVLLVDDEDSVRAVTAMMLETAGHVTSTCRSGLEALTHVEHERPELVLLDLTMPGIDGLETLERLRASDPALPVVLMSGYGEERLHGRLDGDTATRFLQKPFRYEDLQIAIASLTTG